ncbi:histidine-type phosphatase [Facilibium subflavum]|uniref:histidine-type phosphatase n=1 Tax=Facilibium subflavum TaxID=2219058 RepID=UPI000E65718B|nr:histidine-type phosphatase [Facilibium subflavum]
MDNFEKCQSRENIQKVKTHDQRYKLIYYSGHDLTLLAIMGALNLPLKQAPDYASFIQFNIYKHNDQYYIKMRYNGKIVTLNSIQKDKTQISLSAFNYYVKQLNHAFSSAS